MTPTPALPDWENLAKAGRLHDAVVAYVRHQDWVSYPELTGRLSGYMETEGDFTSELRLNLVLWAGMSKAFVDLINDLLQQKRLFIHPSSLMTYLVDGGILRLPLAKSPRPYKKPHWVPVCFRVVPFEAAKKRKRTVL